MLRRKIPQTGHMMTNKKFWLQAIPTNDCDVVMTFPPDTDESTVVWFKARLQRLSELVVITRSLTLAKRATFKPCYAFHITAHYQGFLRGLEELHIPKPLREDFGGGTKEFSLKECNKFNEVEDAEKFLTSAEKSEILLHFLNSLRAEKGDIVANIKFREGEAIVPKCLSRGVIFQLFPLHENDKLKQLQKTWVQRFLAFQPLDLISEYYGIKIGYYFAWLGHYTISLFIPAVVGALFWFLFHGRAEFLEDLGFVMFAFFNVIWATLYLESWKRKSAELSYRWETLDLQRDELLADPRPCFTGEERKSEITGKPELYYSPWKRNLFRYFVTIPVISFALLVVLVSVILILELQQWWDKVIQEQNYFRFLRYGPKILLAMVIPMFDKIYNHVAVWLNDMENYKTEEAYEDNFVVKLILFQFVNSFLALFYTAFYIQDMDKLRELLAALLITRQVVGNIKESLIPYLKKQMRLAKMSFDMFGALSPTEPDNPDNEKEDKKDDGDRKESGDRMVSQAEMEACNPKYEGTFDDYLEMFIQFGYVTLFSSAYPLAGLCALLNNLIEIRSDAFKLCIIHQRPFPQRVQNIGSWQTAMEVMGLIGVIVNCGLIGLSGPVHRIFPNITGSQTVILIIVLEHVMLLLKVLISVAIPDIPEWVCIKMAKLEHRRREAERMAGVVAPMEGGISLDTEEKGVQTNMEVENDADVSASSSSDDQSTPAKAFNNTSKKPEEVSGAPKDNILDEREEFLATVSRMNPEQVFTRHHTLHTTPVTRNKDNKPDLTPPGRKDSRTEQFLRLLEERERKPPENQPKTPPAPSRPSFNTPGAARPNGNTTPPPAAPANKTRNIASLRRAQRQASDTDLLRSLRERQEPFRTSLGSTQELSPDGEKVFVNPDPGYPAMPQVAEVSPAKSSATPTDKRVLDQKEFDKKLKAKRAIFSKSRSISLASFKLPKLKLNEKTLPNVPEKSQLKRVEEKEAMAPIRGELDLIDFASLIDVKDL